MDTIVTSLNVKCNVCGLSIYEGMSNEKSTAELIRVLNRRGGFYCQKHAKYTD